MLEKIIQIKSVGRFVDYAASGDLTFRKLTLIYAENGRGKTTLCAILRSLQNGQQEFIAERKTLAATAPASVCIRLNGANYQFTNDTWASTYPEIAIFDPAFVNDNVYSGDYVEHEHKKNWYRAIVGTTGVQLARQIEGLDRQIRDANDDLRAKTEVVDRYLPYGITLDDYLQWQPVADIEEHLQRKTEELQTLQRAAAKSLEIQGKALFAKLRIPIMPPDFAAVLAKQLTDVIADAEVKVQQQIAKHQMARQGESWLSQGLGYLRDDRCPLCDQVVAASDLIAAYRSHFSTAYANVKRDVALLSQRINSAIGETALSPVQQAIASNAVLVEFWRQFAQIDLPVISFPDVQQKYSTLRERCLALAREKQDSPTEALMADADFNTALAVIGDLRASVAAYNTAVDAANLRVNEQKAATERLSDLTTLKNELTELEARRKRFETTVVQACQAFRDAGSLKEGLQQRKESARQELDQHCGQILTTYEQSINKYLDQFNAGFRITNTRHLYTGGTPSSHYQIEINSTALDLGDERTPVGTPCFKTALSSGDRSALALAFFLAMLKQDANISRKTVVFDDPFTSLDRFRRTCTQQLIQRLLDSAEQVVVLSHDPLFLKLLVDECPSASTIVKTLQMSNAGDATIIGNWDVQAETQSSYMKDFSTLLGFYGERKGEPRAVARAIRPFLGGMLRSRFPGQFQQNEWLGDFINRIRSATATNGLHHAKADLDELDAVNGYSKKYHHQQNENADSEPINDDELHGYVKRTLRLVGGT
jgi:wobble nucleotide-excising tRNase